MPKVIAVAGGGRNAGKTILCEALGSLLPRSVVVKLGVHHGRPEKNPFLFPRETPLEELVSRFRHARFLIVEGGMVLESGKADLGVFLPAPGGPDKEGSSVRKKSAHLIRGVPATGKRELVEERLDVEPDVARRIVKLVERGPLESP